MYVVYIYICSEKPTYVLGAHCCWYQCVHEVAGFEHTDRQE